MTEEGRRTLKVHVDLTFVDLLKSVPQINTKQGWLGPDRRKLMRKTFPQEADLLSQILDDTDFYEAPASTKYHGAYVGGLFDHSMNVACVLKYLTSIGICSKWENNRSPVIVGLLHDFTKIGKYNREEDGTFTYNSKAQSYGGHGSDSVIKLLQILPLNQEEVLCIRYHMGAYEKEDWDGFDRAIKTYPNVLWTHTADIYASKVLEV